MINLGIVAILRTSRGWSSITLRYYTTVYTHHKQKIGVL